MITFCKPLNDVIFLAQTDTTIGFLSKNKALINKAKGAKASKELLIEFASFKYLYYRTPTHFRAFIRRAKKTSFVLSKTKSFRVIIDSKHKEFLQNLGHLYSSSANPTTKGFDSEFAKKCADVIVIDSRGLFPAKSSRILKIRGLRAKKIR